MLFRSVSLLASLAIVAITTIGLHPRHETPRATTLAVAEGRPHEEAQPEPAPSPVVRRGTKSAFTQVEPGETLALVAERIYGSPDEVDRLWRANRDLLPNRDIPLTTGGLLRTP